MLALLLWELALDPTFFDKLAFLEDALDELASQGSQ
jgi:hypothetical protein